MKKTQMAMAALLVAFIIGTGTLPAVQTVHIEQNTEAQFKKGDPNEVVISSDGEISLARQSETVLEGVDEVWVVNALARGTDNSIYVATSGKGYLYRLKQGQEPEVIYGLEDESPRHVFSLAIDGKERLLAGTGGSAGLLLRFDKNDEAEIIFQDDQIKYIWSIAVGPAGRIYLATGPTGKVITLDPEGRNPQILFEGKEKNVLSLALSEEGMVYAGGDEYGLVYRIDPGSQKVTVVYDTGHNEVSALAFDEKGNLYAATADASAAKPGARLILSDGDTSRTETENGDGDGENGGEGEGDNNEGQDKGDDQKQEDTNGEIDKAGDQNGEDEAATEVENEEADEPTELVPAATAEDDNKPAPTQSLTAAEAPPVKPAKANDVYQIAPSGYVRRLFQKEVIIMGMVYLGDDRLLLGTGNEGKLILLEIDTQDAVVLHTVKPSIQVSAVVAGEDGTIYAGGANPGAVLKIKTDYLKEGFFVSEAIDARQVSRWGNLQLEAEIPGGAGLKIATRTGNTSDPDRGGWEDWTEPKAAGPVNPIDSPPGRFLQYKLLFSSEDGTETAVVRSVKLAHTIPNLPPLLKNVTVKRAAASKTSTSSTTRTQPGKTMTISWQSGEPNGDELSFDIFIRQGGQDRWVRIAKDLIKSPFNWDSQTVADGRYEVRIVASDKLSNPAGTELTAARISRAVVVDNTPPQIPDLSYELTGRTLRFEAIVNDALSVIGGVEYVLDSGEKWLPALPDDGIYDNRREKVTFEIEIDELGEHVLAIRFDDALDNRVYRNINFQVP